MTKFKRISSARKYSGPLLSRDELLSCAISDDRLARKRRTQIVDRLCAAARDIRPHMVEDVAQYAREGRVEAAVRIAQRLFLAGRDACNCGFELNHRLPKRGAGPRARS